MNKFLAFFTLIGFWPYVFIFTFSAIVVAGLLMIFQSYWLTGNYFDPNLMTVGLVTSMIDGFILFFLSAFVLRHIVTLKNKSDAVSSELIEQKKALNDYISSSSDFVWEVDSKGRYTFISPGVTNILGYEPDEMLGKTPFDFMTEDEAKNISSKFTSATKDALPIKELENWNISKSGETICLLTNGIPIFDKENKLLGYRGTDKDITEKKEYEELMDKLFNGTSDAILLIQDGKFTRCNDSLLKILGYDSKEKVFNLHPSELSPKYQPDGKLSSEKADEMMNLCLEKGSHNFEWIHLRANNEEFWCDVTLTTIIVNKEALIHVIWRDISHQKQLELDLIAAKEKAEMTSKFKSEFLANMSHEIRTPMNGILGFVEHLQKNEKDPNRIKEFNLIRSSGHTLLHIINDILDFSKIESGNLELESHPYSIYDIVSQTTGIFSESVKNKHINCFTNTDGNIPACLMGDQVRVKQILFNLLSNAIKFTPENGTITLDLKLLTRTDEIQISITDTGIGIPKDKIKRIFEVFGQQDTSTTRKYGGTGLGLNISTKLIEKMGGTLHVESEVHKGSKFYFKLPIIRCNQEELQKEDSNESEVAVELSGHVLVVEDNKTNQMLLGMILKDLGVSYEIANDGVEGIKCMADTKYDIILMDENMPNMNGLEATRQIRLMEQNNAKEQIPIIAVTANALTEDRQRFLDAGMDDYISKPYTQEDIIKVLQKYLG